MLVFTFFCIFSLLQVQCSLDEGRTVFGKLKSGFQLAGKLLGIDHATGVAQLVTDAFGKTHPKGDTASGNIFSGFLRVLGFDTKKIGAIAVNAIIFVAQLISTSLSRPLISQTQQARKVPTGSPFDWMMNLSGVAEMIEHVQDKELPNHIIMHIKEKSLDEETDCVQMLICKTAPFVWGMQKAIKTRNESNISGPKSLYAYLPEIGQVEEHGESCETKHPYCFTTI